MEQCTHAFKKCFSESSCNLLIIKVEGYIKGCFAGICTRHDNIITDDVDDPRENTLIKPEDNAKLGMTASTLKDKFRMQTQGEELVRQQLKDCCESQAERESTVPVLPDNASARQE